MAQCECLPRCAFFNDKMPGSSGIGAMYKQRYCLGDCSNCARHMVFAKLGPSAVPSNLYPNMQEQARQILASRG